MNSPQFYASSLRATDCVEASSLYAELFQGEILQAKLGHAEVLFSKNHRVVFSRETDECPVSTGTLIWKISRAQYSEFSSNLRKRSFLLEADLHAYVSFLDPWGNRIWLVAEDR
ncbi:hypothetical protein LEP1GSC047_0791 [Leptospira inadai serovar Lyme str. 10]|uniref:Glyoxalase-like domain protein n=2 Tax=Leptospira inadai serovar Lyme TaxID=293084 RepID=V6HDD9_9LEPT|nr:hypothetical protein [Leptospira inadai]EQA37098.1 hypothetical protein LEP1GSC047_0791 [Leptospira inadai serovar Lyme str. 10]PNV76652.1 hypothetical protein BES34_003475 [Leptospira inadai serovar Lyme]